MVLAAGREGQEENTGRGLGSYPATYKCQSLVPTHGNGDLGAGETMARESTGVHRKGPQDPVWGTQAPKRGPAALPWEGQRGNMLRFAGRPAQVCIVAPIQP